MHCTIDESKELRPINKCNYLSLIVLKGAFDSFIFEILLIKIKLKWEGHIVLGFLILLYLNEEHSLFCYHNVFIGLIDFFGFDDFNYIAYLRVSLIFIFIVSLVQLLLMIFNCFFNIEWGNNHVARWLKDLYFSFFTCQNCIVFRVSMVFSELKDATIKIHLRLNCKSGWVNSNNLFVIKCKKYWIW